MLPLGYCRRGPGVPCVAKGAAGGFALWHIWSVTYSSYGCAGSTAEIVHYHHTVLCLMFNIMLGIVTLTTSERNVPEKLCLMSLDINCNVVVQ